MRFRATIVNVPTFFKIIQAVEKLQKKCIIKFSETHMSIICNHEANEGGIQVWSQIKVDSLFHNYRIQSNANNEITVMLSAEALLGALKSGSGGNNSADSETEEMVVKLAKKADQALLSFELNGTTRVGHSIRVNQDVKIDVMRPADVEKLKEPLCPEPDVHILLPPLSKLRPTVDRLKSMSEVLAIRANHSQHLQLAINTEGVKVEGDWKNCQNPQTQSEGEQQERDPEELFTVLVSTKSFLKFLNSHVVSTTTIACLCQHHCVILYVYIGDVVDAGGVLTYYIPAIIDDEDR